jgi:hypothetical protein
MYVPQRVYPTREPVLYRQKMKAVSSTPTADRFEYLAKPPVVQESRCIGRDLDACAYVTENGGRLEERDVVSGVCERKGLLE